MQSADDQAFCHYTTKRRVVAWISQNLCDNVTYTVRHGLIKGMKRKGGLAWLPEFINTMTAEDTFWTHQDFSGRVMYDIGAFHGLLTLLFARKGRQVISYEPHTKNHSRLIDNIRLNALNNVFVRKVAIGSKVEVATMVAYPLMPGGASIDCEKVTRLLDSNLPRLSEQVYVTTLDDDIQKMVLPPPNFIKIDIEGGELAALHGARNTLLTYRPQLFLELHGETMNLKRKNVAALVAYLHELGYREIRHVETGARINSANSSLAAEGHLYCP